MLRLGRDLQHPQPRAGRASSGTARRRNIVATGAQVLVTANPGCLMQVTSAIERSGHPMGMAHTIEVLDASIAGRPATTLLATARTEHHGTTTTTRTATEDRS